MGSPLSPVIANLYLESLEETAIQIPCKECPEVYMGETKRTLKVRLSEYRQAVK